MVDYTTQSNIENYLNITFNQNPDPTLALMISHVSALIDAYCNRDFTQHTGEVEYHDGQGQYHNTIILRNYPVLEVTSVKEDGTLLTETEEYVWYEDGRIVKCSNGYIDPKNVYWKAKAKVIEVTYDYGYTSVPPEITTICTHIVIEWLKRWAFKFTEIGSAENISLSGISVNFKEIEILPEWAMKRLNRYKKVLAGII